MHGRAVLLRSALSQHDADAAVDQYRRRSKLDVPGRECQHAGNFRGDRTSRRHSQQQRANLARDFKWRCAVWRMLGSDLDTTDDLFVDLTESLGTLSPYSVVQRDSFEDVIYLNPGGTLVVNGKNLTIPY